MAAKKIRIGIAGIGRAGWGMHCSELDKYKDLYEIVAACDIEQERLDKMAQRYPKCRTYLKYDDFLKDKNMEMVAVAVRSPEHTEFALKALKAGKYVFLEKPIALSYADAKRLVAAAKKYPGSYPKKNGIVPGVIGCCWMIGRDCRHLITGAKFYTAPLF